MAAIDASRITRAALRALPLRRRFDAAVELAAIRKADKGDDWADFLAWPT